MSDDSNVGGAVPVEAESLARSATAAYLERAQSAAPEPAPQPVEPAVAEPPADYEYDREALVERYPELADDYDPEAEFGPEPVEWQGPSQEEYESVRDSVAAIAEYLHAATQPEPEPWDPLADNADEELLARVGEVIEQRVAEVQQQAEQALAEQLLWADHVAEQAELGTAEAEHGERLEQAYAERTRLLGEIAKDEGPHNADDAHSWANLLIQNDRWLQANTGFRSYPQFQRAGQDPSVHAAVREALRQGAELTRGARGPYPKTEKTVSERYFRRNQLLGDLDDRGRLEARARLPVPTLEQAREANMDPAAFARAKSQRFTARAELARDR